MRRQIRIVNTTSILLGVTFDNRGLEKDSLFTLGSMEIQLQYYYISMMTIENKIVLLICVEFVPSSIKGYHHQNGATQLTEEEVSDNGSVRPSTAWGCRYQ